MTTISQLYDKYYAQKKQGDTTQAQWQQTANQVSEMFGVHRPKVIISKRIDARAKYFGYAKAIRISEHNWGGIKDAFYHEIAHHIVRERFGKVKSHGRQFKRILWNVVCKCYANPQDYGWAKDYRAVNKYAEKRIAKLTQ